LQVERRPAILHEVASDREHKVVTEHVLPERLDGRLADRRVAAAHGRAVAPDRLVPGVAVLPQANRVLQHRRTDARGVVLDCLEAVAATDAATHDMELAE